MTKATTSNNRNEQLDTLADALAQEIATAEMRMANYFTPYGFDPGPQDVVRIKGLMLHYGESVTAEVFGQASPNLQSRVANVYAEWNERHNTLLALTKAGAQPTLNEDELFQNARNTIFGNTPAPNRRVA